MSKRELSPITRAASLAAKALERIESAGSTAEKKLETASQSLRLVADGKNASAIINVPGLSIRYQDGQFAVDIVAQAGGDDQ